MMVHPCVTELYAALYASQSFEQKFVRTRQIKHTLIWIAALLADAEYCLERRFTLDAFQGRGTSVVMCLDDSPWGLGGFLAEGGVVVSWFASPIGEIEQSLLDISVADCSCQQTVEALAVLAALRCWSGR